MRELGLANLDVYVTGSCNYACEYCYGEDYEAGHMSRQVFGNALEFARYIGANNIQLCGGEPMVCPDIEHFIMSSREQGFDVILRTNGTLLEGNYELIAGNCKWVGISLDGMPRANALVRCSRSPMTPDEQFDKPIRAIYALKERRPAIRILLASLAGRPNLEELPAFGEYLVRENIPIDRWKVYEFITDKYRSVENRSKYALTAQEFETLCKRLPQSINCAPVICQSAHTYRVSANCLIVSQSGDIKLMGRNYGNVASDSHDRIIDKLLEDDALAVIRDNKEVTYGNDT